MSVSDGGVCLDDTVPHLVEGQVDFAGGYNEAVAAYLGAKRVLDSEHTL